LAWLTTETSRLPAFQLMALAFAVPFALTWFKWLVFGQSVRERLRLPLRVWLLGLFGIFGYHAFFFVALRRAPAAEANLLNYLWPVLLALGSSLLPGERLRWWHVAGSALGFTGAALVASGGGAFRFRADAWVGYGAALACALIWPVYSIVSRRFAKVSTDAVGAFCGATAALALGLHLALERWVALTPLEWVYVVSIGAGPLGLALFAWDVGMKHGNVRALAAASYLQPLLSTLVLVGFGRGQLSVSLVVACLFIVAGAVTGGWDVVRANANSPAQRT
jgi:drug/metabolite transporter (DMT)-like permease